MRFDRVGCQSRLLSLACSTQDGQSTGLHEDRILAPKVMSDLVGKASDLLGDGGHCDGFVALLQE
ncbi:hypothetical protein D3C87_2138170 [compost metagenome]